MKISDKIANGMLILTA